MFERTGDLRLCICVRHLNGGYICPNIELSDMMA